MIFIDSFKLPSQDEIDKYYIATDDHPYPWPIFFDNLFEWVDCKDITIFYGNNGSGKSTILNLIAEKIKAQRNNEMFKDIIYAKYVDRRCPFDDFVKSIKMQMADGDDGKPLIMPHDKKLITSDNIFKRIDERSKHNKQSLAEIDEARDNQKKIVATGYKYKNSDDYNDLVKLIEARKLSHVRYAAAHSSAKEQMRSNGETALEYYIRSFDSNGIYLLDEPENCLSPIFQIELIKQIQDSAKYFNCQFFICTHSPLLLSLSNAVIYNLDLIPVVSQKWEELENVKIYYDFFKQNEDKFTKNDEQ